MKVELEVTGGFTGPAGKQVLRIDSDRLPPDQASALRRDLEQLPASVWGQTFLAAHPKPWDFRHVLRVTDGAAVKTVTFHKGEGPAPLSRLAEQLTEEIGTTAT